MSEGRRKSVGKGDRYDGLSGSTQYDEGEPLSGSASFFPQSIVLKKTTTE
jgi:hypothetical protein